MKVYVTPPVHQSVGVSRIAEALARYAPTGIDITHNRSEAELIVIHVLGRVGSLSRETAELLAEGRRYALIQYTLRSTQKPHTSHWWPVWQQAKTIWCTYDLRAKMAEDKLDPSSIQALPHYYAPYGADHNIFTLQLPAHPRPFLLCTTGFSWMTESVREVATAASRHGGKVFHLGPELNRDYITCAMGIDDQTLATYYRQCQWVSGLRRTEGFELPAVEGLLCGARPILYDCPHYTHWYGPHAEYVPQYELREDILQHLTGFFSRKKLRKVTRAERDKAVKKFHWPTLVEGFWKQVLA
jgi:hypothetical protein